MSQTDPYIPPQSSLGGLTPSEQDARAAGELRYSGFWERVGAYLIDFLILSPLVAVDYLYGSQSRLFQLYMLIPGQLLSVFLYVFMVVKYGGTPGKLLLGLRIAKLDGARVGIREAVLRYGVLWVLSLTMSGMLINAALGIPNETYTGFGYLERSAALSEQAPKLWIATLLMQVWVVGCLIAILANKKRRTLHDFIAGTVVVRK
jgi:uncharacterized RDD family membrane protein YckC